MAATQEKKPTGLNLLGEEVKIHSPGSLYQVVPGDPTNEEFTDIIRKGAKEWAGEEDDD